MRRNERTYEKVSTIRQWQKMRIRFILIVAVVLFLFGGEVMAQESVTVSSTVVADGIIYVYIRGIDNLQAGSTVQIGTTVCPTENLSAGKQADLDIPMRTLLLVDNSYSIPKKKRQEIQDIMTGLIDQALPNEQFKIGTFSDEATYLCDYTEDRDTAYSCIENIEYQNQNTYFSDVLYHILTELKSEQSASFTRVILISDGADDNEIGYTNEEVRILVGESGVPVYTIGTLGKSNQSELETMFAFSRASNAEYYLLDGNTSVEDVLLGLAADQGNLCVRIKPSTELMDGSNKKILLKLQTENGMVELTASAEMPFAANDLQLESKEDSGAQEPDAVQKEPVPSVPSKPLPTIVNGTSAEEEIDTKADKKQSSKGSVILIVIIVSVAACGILAAITVAVMIRRRKKASAPVLPMPEGMQDRGIHSPENPEYTVTPWDVEFDRKKFYLILRSLDNPAIIYRQPIKDVVHIGRKDADIVIDDRYVSARHCDIILRGELLYIRDVGSSNGTFYENIPVHDELPIVSGGTIRIGRSNFRVELIKE